MSTVVEPAPDAAPAVVVTSSAPDAESPAAEEAAPTPVNAPPGGAPEPSGATSAAPEPSPSLVAVDSSAAAPVALAAPIPEGSDASPQSNVSASAPAETLDFASLVTRLRRTKAISLLTKMSVKNQSNDLLQEFRAYHAQDGTATLAELRRSYDSLFGTLCSLLQEGDPPLARDIDRSRAAIWEVLADPRKFGASQLLAGG